MTGFFWPKPASAGRLFLSERELGSSPKATTAMRCFISRRVLLARTSRVQAALVDHLFNSSEKRLARILLLLAHFGEEGVQQTLVPKISQQTLAQMTGSTRSRVCFFLNRFRELGYIEYGEQIRVNNSLLQIFLND
jgi:CRP/FNR family transcriptional regulator, cyclic AMP receptor protein